MLRLPTSLAQHGAQKDAGMGAECQLMISLWLLKTRNLNLKKASLILT